jgi:hypothetical protein
VCHKNQLLKRKYDFKGIPFADNHFADWPCCFHIGNAFSVAQNFEKRTQMLTWQ